MTTYQGSCACGSVRYTAQLEQLVRDICFCSTCRKVHASAFTTGISLEEKDFKIERGEHLLTRFESSPGIFRCFCQKCGSHLFKVNENNPGMVRLRPECLDNASKGKLGKVLFEEEMPDWFKQYLNRSGNY